MTRDQQGQIGNIAEKRDLETRLLRVVTSSQLLKNEAITHCALTLSMVQCNMAK